MYQPDVKTHVVPFDEIVPHVQTGHAEAGLIIHEGQLTYADEGLHLVADLGEWWAAENDGLPLPLGGNAIRRDLGPELIRRVSGLLRDSIAYGLDHRDDAVTYALEYGRGLDRAQTDEFVGMYVNRRTLDYGEDGRRSVQLFLDRGFQAGLIPHRVAVEFVDD
jgi:1,4-dihydroxy-6-naphthoate synthase